MIKAIIVDDEETGRYQLRKLVNENEELIQLIGEAGNVDSACEMIAALKPDLVLLDVQMPVQSGFDLLEKIPVVDFEVVFTTAYSEYAIQAIRFSALDYLLKPISSEDFSEMLRRARQKKKNEVQISVSNLLSQLKKPSRLEKLVIPSLDGLTIIDIQDVISCEANSSYTIFKFVSGESIMSTKTLKEYEDMLTSERFFRIHKSTLINLKHIVKYHKGEGGYVVMKDNNSYEVSRRKKNELLDLLSTIF